MDQGLKQRLVGAAVLVALVVTFVPMLLESQNGPDNFDVRFGKPAEPEIDYLLPMPALRPAKLPLPQVPEGQVIDKPVTGKASSKPATERHHTKARRQARGVHGKAARNRQAPRQTPPGRPGPKKTTAKTAVSKKASAATVIPAKTVLAKVTSSHLKKVRKPTHESTRMSAKSSVATTRSEPPRRPAMDRGNTGRAPVEERVAVPTNSGPAAAHGRRGWAVQLGSFTERANAMKLRDRLLGKKFTAYVEDVAPVKTGRYRVRVGTVISKSRANELRRRIKQDLGMDSLLVRYP